MPERLNDRQQDCWGSLFAIAGIAGGKWVERAKNAALCISGEPVDESLGVQLLSDIRDIFEERGLAQLSSEVLTNDLIAITDSPWPEANRGRAITQNWLARKLKQYGVRPKNVGPEQKRVSGYASESFADALKHYLPPFQGGQSSSPNENSDLGEKQSGQPDFACPVANWANPLKSNEEPSCPVETPLDRGAHAFPPDFDASGGADPAEQFKLRSQWKAGVQ